MWNTLSRTVLSQTKSFAKVPLGSSVRTTRAANYNLLGSALRHKSAAAATVSIPEPPKEKVNPSLIIFDKDGTLIDFNLMWSSWVEQFAWKLENTCHVSARERLFELMGYDYAKRSVHSGGALCCTPMHELRNLGEQALQEKGFTPGEAKAAVDNVWSMPDARETARPLADLEVLFSTLKQFNIKIAVCTTDNHEATKVTLEHLNLIDYVEVIVGGDDPIRPKPNPEQIWTICHKLGVSPNDTIMVGDTNTDMAMGRAAGVGLSVGVLGGASSISDLSQNADVLIPDLSRLIKIIFQFHVQSQK